MSSEADRQREESQFLFIARPSGIASVDPGYLQPRYRRQITVRRFAEAQLAILLFRSAENFLYRTHDCGFCHCGRWVDFV